MPTTCSQGSCGMPLEQFYFTEEIIVVHAKCFICKTEIFTRDFFQKLYLNFHCMNCIPMLILVITIE